MKKWRLEPLTAATNSSLWPVEDSTCRQGRNCPLRLSLQQNLLLHSCLTCSLSSWYCDLDTNWGAPHNGANTFPSGTIMTLEATQVLQVLQGLTALWGPLQVTGVLSARTSWLLSGPACGSRRGKSRRQWSPDTSGSGTCSGGSSRRTSSPAWLRRAKGEGG